LVPESGDEIQNIKSGLMEIADAFIINKADRPDAELFANNLKKIVNQQKEHHMPVFKTVASNNSGIDEVVDFIQSSSYQKNKRKEILLAERAYKIIQQKRMVDIDKKKLQQIIAKALDSPGFNLYQLISDFGISISEL
jgi:LAO/AO transport system kinase